MFIYSCYARLISFEINPNPPINALATALPKTALAMTNHYIDFLIYVE